ncbi:MAG: glycosyltransferase [Saprospiraceae bacterium]
MDTFDIGQPIKSHIFPTKGDELFSILIPSWKNFAHLKLLIESIRKNSSYPHQICVHLNGNSPESEFYLKNENISYTITQENVGVCLGTNSASTLATCDYILILNDDMYVAPKWDFYLYEQIQKRKDNLWCISGTMIEWQNKNNPCVIVSQNFGSDAIQFDESLFLSKYNTYLHQDWNGSQWYPLVVHRSVWLAVGGLSIEFSPGMYSDPDFMMKLWKIGIRDFMGVNQSRVYHFMSKSTERVKKNDGKTQFLLKWQISNSTFLKYYLRLGETYSGKLENPDTKAIKWILLKDRLKKLGLLMS